MSPSQTAEDERYMLRALELAKRGQGHVEPNPMVGAVIVAGGEVVGEGWHTRYGDAHAEIEALRRAGGRASDAVMYVTLEPCCHYGKTPPCVEAVVEAGLRRVVIAEADPFPAVGGGGVQRLQEVGVDTVVGVLGQQSHDLNAPYHRLLGQHRPWVLAKWAMSLDGKIATHSGNSQWISNEQSRARVHQIRGRMDAILIGAQTALHDDPQLTARPRGARTAVRIVLDSTARLPLDSNLVSTAEEAPVLVVVSQDADQQKLKQLEQRGCEIWTGAGEYGARLSNLLQELGKRRMTNLLVEGGGRVLGQFIDGDLVDEVHVFVAPKIIGGEGAASPVAGEGASVVDLALRLQQPAVELLGDDTYLRGRIARTEDP